MNNIRPEVEAFMRACERLFGFAHTEGRLTPEECDVLFYYADEIHNKITPFCQKSEAP
jgi:hypothetical protein